MIFQARDEFNLNLRNSILVGDSICDIDAGINAGIGMLLFRNKMEYKTSIRIENNFHCTTYEIQASQYGRFGPLRLDWQCHLAGNIEVQ